MSKNIAVVGTVADVSFPLCHGKVSLADGRLHLRDSNLDYNLEVNRGTPALMAAAVKAAEAIGNIEVYGFLVGDTGRGDGSRKLYRFLEGHLFEFDFDILTFHYLQPDVDWHNRVLFAVEAMARRPVLIADAGFMYAAKMSGQAGEYDLFTPDSGELAFLADEIAPHPFYTRGFILHQNNQMPDLIRRAYQHQNGAKHLLVKGKTDYVADADQVIETIDTPSFEAMEAIGGTGDTLTGLLSVLCAAGFKPADAAIMAARANRWTGHYAKPNPATQVLALINTIPAALAAIMDKNNQEKTA